MGDELSPDDKRKVDQFLLEQTYQSIRTVYSGISGWTTILMTAWALLFGLGFEATPKSGAMLLLSSFGLLILAYELQRTGQNLGALVATALRLEKELGVSKQRSIAYGFVAGFRGRGFVKHLDKLNSIDDVEEWESALQRTRDYAIFSVFRSKTNLAAAVIGTSQLIVTSVLILLGRLSL